MQISGTYISCGIRQLWNLCETRDGNWKNGIRKVQEMMYNTVETRQGCNCPVCREAAKNPNGVAFKESCRFLVFSDADEYGYGMRFAEYLKQQKLGVVTEVCFGKNPNSGHQIRLWSWELPPPAEFMDWMKDSSRG